MSEPVQGSAEVPVRVVVADDHPLWRDAVASDLAEAGQDLRDLARDIAAADASPGALRRRLARSRTRPDTRQARHQQQSPPHSTDQDGAS